jgi:seryl-tRNA synthetase
MLTAKYVRDHLDEIKASLAKRQLQYPIAELLELDDKYRKLQKQEQDLRTKRNKGSEEVSKIKKSGKEAGSEKVKELADIRKQVEELEKQRSELEQKIHSILWNMPNVLDVSVPYGKDDAGNLEIRKEGKVEKRKMKTHDEILKELDLLDLDQAAKVSGARFYYLKGDLALLEQALIRFQIDELIKKGYTLISPPLMIRSEYYKGVTAMADFQETLYKVGDSNETKERPDLEKIEDDLYLIATSEHAIAAFNADKLYSARELPKRFVGISPCFRREAGSHGKDTKGIFRVHQFYKVEQFIVCKENESAGLFDELISNSEDLCRKLKLPYRVVNICTGDIGTVAAKKYDIEGYMPGQDKYRELVSCSNCTDWQSLRLDIKYDEAGERKYAHTLNSTAMGSTTRAIVAIVENYYNEKTGKITVPEVLVPYMNGKKEIG